MAKIEVSRYVNDQGMEAYASACGKHVGMSQRALARMTKTDEQPLRAYLKKNGCNPMVVRVLAAGQVGAKQVSLVSYQDCGKYIRHIALSQRVSPEAREQCMAIIEATSDEGLRIGLLGLAGWQAANPGAVSNLERESTVPIRVTFTDAIKSFIGSHPDMSENAKRFIYSNATNALYRTMFGMSASQLMAYIKENGIEPTNNVRKPTNPRDYLQPRALSLVKSIEDALTVRLSDDKDSAVDEVKRVTSYILDGKPYPLDKAFLHPKRLPGA